MLKAFSVDQVEILLAVGLDERFGARLSPGAHRSSTQAQNDRVHNGALATCLFVFCLVLIFCCSIVVFIRSLDNTHFRFDRG